MATTKTLTKTLWTLDPSHSEIGFKVKHLMVTNVRGVFKEYKGGVYTTGDDFQGAEINISINTGSISTGDDKRDGHLKSADFFGDDNFKEINFKGTKLEKIKGSKYVLSGDLSIRGVTKRIELDLDFNGIVKDPWGAQKAGFEVTGKISRKDFGLTWNTVLETGGVMIGDEVSIKCEIQLTQQTES